MDVQPQDLLGFGDVYEWSDDIVEGGHRSALALLEGPSLTLKWGGLAIADPWWTEGLPSQPVITFRIGEHPVALSAIDYPYAGGLATFPCAAVIGRYRDVVAWHPLSGNNEHFHLDIDTGIAAFYDANAGDVLAPLSADPDYMHGVWKRAMADRLVPLEHEGRVYAVVFQSGKGYFPAYIGADEDGSGAAVLIDLETLDGATGRERADDAQPA